MILGNDSTLVTQLNQRSVEDRLNFLTQVVGRAFTDFRHYQRPNRVNDLPNTFIGKSKKNISFIGI